MWKLGKENCGKYISVDVIVKIGRAKSLGVYQKDRIKLVTEQPKTMWIKILNTMRLHMVLI